MGTLKSHRFINMAPVAIVTAKTFRKYIRRVVQVCTGSYCHHPIFLQKTSIFTKNVKIARKMAELCQFNVLAQKWHLTYFLPINGHFGHFLRYELQICLPFIYINFDIQTKFEVYQTQIGHSISKKLQKLTKVAIPQNPILPKCHSPKSLLLLHL